MYCRQLLYTSDIFMFYILRLAKKISPNELQKLILFIFLDCIHTFEQVIAEREDLANNKHCMTD